MTNGEAGRASPHHDEFFDGDGSPQLTRCAVLFVDLLGITQLALSEDASKYLKNVERSAAVVTRLPS